jgi:hypothetical protein
VPQRTIRSEVISGAISYSMATELPWHSIGYWHARVPKAMREWKARKISHDGELYYDVVSTARLLRTTAAKVQHLMGQNELEWTQLRPGGNLLVRAKSVVDFKQRLSEKSERVSGPKGAK